MKIASRVNVRWPVLAVAAVVLLAVGAGAAYFGLRSGPWSASAPRDSAGTAPISAPSVPPSAETDAPASAAGPLSDVVVTLSPEAIARAGITVTAVTAGASSDGLRAPGVVEANAYKQIVVTPLVSGRITRVAAELGQQVKRGQTIAQIFSPELAEAQTRYVSTRAALEAHDQELARTEKLVAIGAASKQELERIHAEHTARRAEVQSVAARLQLLGLSAKAIDSLGPGRAVDATTSVTAPIDGVVTRREANVGTNVDQATQLFTIVDLSSVWVVVDVYEKDFALVRVGSAATITTRAYPGLALQGRVSYIDAQVSAETRTAKARVEVPNARAELRLGMYAEAMLGSAGAPTTPMIPRTAVQNVGDRTVVYLVDPKKAGRFVEREVRLGGASGDRVAIVAGVEAADVVVSEGSFYVRAERERLGLRGGAAAPAGHGSMAAGEAVQQANVSVTEAAFNPQRLTLKAGVPARITFTRTSDKTCATEVVFAALNIRRELPLNQPVAIEFTPDTPGEITFACGMNMLRGSLVVERASPKS